jgi:two-component system, cell cycle response regulator
MKPRILIIEDNETNLELMLYLLQEPGYTLLTARDGEAGLALVRQERPDLVLCDIQLPKLDGYEVAQRMKADADLRAIPIIAVTALAMVGDQEKGLAAGFDGYLSKPLTPTIFIQQVEAFLRPPANAEAAPAGVAANEDHPPKKKATILVVDDLTANTTLIESLLVPFGHHVVCASGLAGALVLARRLRPDLVVSDVHMRDGSGYELCQALKADQDLKNIPLILMTSTYHDEAARQKGLALGATRFLFRPLDSLRLLGEIEDCLPRVK